MSQISQQRLIEMEAEMDRFEQEIQAGDDLPKVVIGSNTYNQVSAQLKMLRASSGVSAEERERKHQEVAAQLKMLRASTENMTGWNEMPGSPPQDDSDDEHDFDEDRSRLVGRNEPPLKKPALDLPILPPPPPPPPSLSSPFVPPQLKHRPPPPPNRPSMQGPPRMRPPPPRHFGGPMGPGPMGPGPMGGPMGGPMSGPPGPFMPGPRPGFGPMGPGGPGPMRGPYMGPGPGPFMQGPRPMGGPPPQDPMSQGMYGVSSGESHIDLAKEDKEDEEDKPKATYSSAPVITVIQKKKEKKKKKKKKAKEEGEGSTPTPSTAISSTTTPDVTTETVPMTATPVSTVTEPGDDFHVADMELDNQFQSNKKEKKEKKKKFVRMAAGTTWEDQSLSEWDPDDFRLFCGDLGNEVTDETLGRAFNKYPSFVKAKVLRDKRSNKTKGYGFVSFKDPNDYVRAMREMNGKYVGNRPIKLRKSNWRDRNIDVVKKKEKEKKRLGLK